MKKMFLKNLITITIATLFISSIFMVFKPEQASAGSSNGQNLAFAILTNQSTLISSSYTDNDQEGCRQGIVLESLGTMLPTNGSTFALLSTGIAGSVPVTTGGICPGDERGTWFKNEKGHPRDKSTLTMVLKVPPYMHYLYYDFQFFSTELPEFPYSKYNDKFTVTVNSPSKGVSTYVCDIESGNFLLNSNDIIGTGFDIFAQSGNPNDVDIVDRTPRTPGADAGATVRITRGGESHPITPNEQITVTFSIEDVEDNLFDSAVYIDNLRFSGEARAEIMGIKVARDLNGQDYECNDIVEYKITISNIGNYSQEDNTGNEFEDVLPGNMTYINNSATASSGNITYDQVHKKIIWNGGIQKDSSVILKFQASINLGLEDGTIIPNQGIIRWDSDGDHINDAIGYTDDDGIGNDTTNIVISSFEPPSTVTEDFSDDYKGKNATQYYSERKWFETTYGEKIGGKFQVVSAYRYSTSNAFKTQLRGTYNPQYWIYNLSALRSDIKWWEIWFACGNGSEEADLILTFKNLNNQDIAKIKFEYDHVGTQLPTEWLVKVLYWSQNMGGWERLETNYTADYLYNNGWYKLRIEKQDATYINYTLYSSYDGYSYSKLDRHLTAPFSNLQKIEWTSTKNSVACPIFFWDEHSIGLIEI